MKKIALPIPLIALSIGVSSIFGGVIPPPPPHTPPPLSFAHDFLPFTEHLWEPYLIQRFLSESYKSFKANIDKDTKDSRILLSDKANR